MANDTSSNRTPRYEAPWSNSADPKPYWYHSMRFPDGSAVKGSWTIEDFSQYIGGYDLKGKTVLDVGTASGYLAFNAEKAGAIVTGLDAASTHEFRHVPFASSLSYRDVTMHRDLWEVQNLRPIKASWWHAWHKFGSRAQCVYAPMPELYEWEAQSFDVVMAGAIVEHLSDPVYAIGAWARLAREAVLIPFTDVVPLDDLLLHPITTLDNPSVNYVWWHLSRGLYVKLFDNLGFDVFFTTAHAEHHDAEGGSELATRPSIIAVRRPHTFDASKLVDPTRPAPVPPAPEPETPSPEPEPPRSRGLLGRLGRR